MWVFDNNLTDNLLQFLTETHLLGIVLNRLDEGLYCVPIAYAFCVEIESIRNLGLLNLNVNYIETHLSSLLNT